MTDDRKAMYFLMAVGILLYIGFFIAAQVEQTQL